MGAAVLANSGEVLLLTAALSGQLFVRLFNTPIPVTWVSLLSDFPVCVFPGYADQDITGMWPDPAIDGTGQAYSPLPLLTWVRGTGGLPETVYGWVMYQEPEPDSVLVAGNLLTTPIPTSIAGEVVVLSLLTVLLRG